MFNEIFGVIGLLGIGGILGNYFRILWERQNKAQLQKQEYKETRYKCIIMLLLATLDFENEKERIREYNRLYIESLDDLIREIKLELDNMLLFASDEVLMRMSDFIIKPSRESFLKVALAMRKDLWGGKISAKKIGQIESRVRTAHQQ